MRVERTCYAIAAVLVAAGLFHVGVLLVTGGTWVGPLSYRKPATFGLSFGLTLATVTWLASYVALGRRVRTAVLSVLAAACVLETALITVQAWRRVPSHFNLSTPVDGVIARVLAGGGAALIAVVAVLTVAAWRTAEGVAPSMRVALRAGFTLLSASMLTGAVMIAMGVTRVIAGDQQGAYSTGGVLKPVHGVALHAVLVLPALAWLLGRAGWPEERRLRVVQVATVAYVLVTVVTLAWTLVR
jgi:hypothetical protein